VQQYNDSRSTGLGTATTEPEHETQTTVMEPEASAIGASPSDSAGYEQLQRTEGALDMSHPTMDLDRAAEPADYADDDEEMSMAELLDNPANAIHELQRGEVVEGWVARIDADEILVDIGQKSEGVISNREMGSVGDNGVLKVGQKVLVYVMQPDSAEGHAVLSLKRARMEQSWRDAEQMMNEDRVIEAPVVDFNKGGLIVEVGVRGFVPISQISELRGLAKGADGGDSPLVAERLASMRGRVLKLKIIELNRARNRLILSERLAVQEERAGRKEALMQELEPGQVRPGRVTSLASFGAFVDLGGADGLVHISQLSYSRVNHPSEILSVGDEVQVYVLSIDPQTRKIALSLKKAQPDPWTLVEDRYKVGDVVHGTITKLAKFGAFARIDDGIEGLIHLTELSDEPVEKPQDVVSEGQEVKLRVIAINSQRRRLGLSLRQAMGDVLRPVEVPAEFDDYINGEDAGRGSRSSRSTSDDDRVPAPTVEASTDTTTLVVEASVEAATAASTVDASTDTTTPAVEASTEMGSASPAVAAMDEEKQEDALEVKDLSFGVPSPDAPTEDVDLSAESGH